MRHHLILAGLSALLASGAQANRLVPPAEEPTPHRLVLVDETMLTEEPDPWRLSADSFAPESLPNDPLSLKVKVRPNRAMGRMSLSF